MEAEEKNRKRKLDLDWNKLLSRQAGDEEPPPPLEVIKNEPRPLSRKFDAMGGDDDQSQEEFFEKLPDHKLEAMFQRQQRLLENLGCKLPDKGKKIRDSLERLEEEKKRRTLSRAKMGGDGCEKPSHSPSSDIVGEVDYAILFSSYMDMVTMMMEVKLKLFPAGSSIVFGQHGKSHQAFSQSIFGANFCKKMEENRDCWRAKAFEKDFSILNHCERQKTRFNGVFSSRRRQRVRVSPRRMNSQHRRKPFFGDQKGRTASLYSLQDTDDDLPGIAKKNAFKVQPSNDSRRKKGQIIVLVDEEEPQPVKTAELEVKLPDFKKDARVYYPSRDDPESIEICFGDIDCLAPETFMTSQIMNFYIRYLQQQASPTNRAMCDYHFFNTYFYQKLKEAVSYKGSDKDALFIKFRRWWKGVNLFQKAYVLIPINEDFHWSLVIICIPDKEDESGPIILHLDSLGLHSSRSVFKNIKSYMREEWSYLNQEVAPSDLPIADKIRENLPCSIDEKTIAGAGMWHVKL
ncbi:hypothetical protein DITRI_Ditri17bG0061800 [Diplodiscus trichospermus]